MDNQNLIKGIVALTIILNLCDAVMTVFWTEAGLATEANPFMDMFLAIGPVMFVFVKLGLVSTGLWVLWWHRQRKLSVAAIVLVFLVYCAIMWYHLQAIETVAGV